MGELLGIIDPRKQTKEKIATYLRAAHGDVEIHTFSHDGVIITEKELKKESTVEEKQAVFDESNYRFVDEDGRVVALEHGILLPGACRQMALMLQTQLNEPDGLEGNDI